jgi:Zn-dependent protease
MTILEIIFVLIIVLFSAIIHEIAHGSVALAFGDPTARDAGRLSLNPLRHFDFFGFILLPLVSYIIFGFPLGSAKPVPVNPLNFRNRKWGELAVATAGSFTNLLLGITFALFIRFFSLPLNLLAPFSFISFFNFLLGIFNLVPIPPLDGSHIVFLFFPEKWIQIKIFLQQFGFIILISLIYFTNGRILDWVAILAQYLFKLLSGIVFQ